ncbi:MAG TPA: prepilin-type N-terminal cleavage/methylation domain-containing protein [Candidatus Saccharimonadales bacterium]|jgi:prepilin-type N-terminal cleavage/methylation domain-containing protein|nr:prepilin-type N-terminal cleavage/methylation domain-containing protein [Candidatus Saccharimonadales bacterium]
MANSQFEAGFTLVEIMITIAIIATLAALTLVNLGKPQVTASQNSTVDTLVADLKSQQLLAIAGDSGGSPSQQPQGVYIQAGQYTLFAGPNFDSQDANNFSITASQDTTFSTTFPGSKVVFTTGNGEVQNFSGTTNAITVHHSGDTKTITINRLGAVTVN